jgi:RimJ/RimL family protein N-acetyltransferase
VATDSNALWLRPLRASDLEILERVDTDPTVSEPFEWRGFADPRVRRRRWEKDSYLGPDDSLLVVALADDTVMGFVSWRFAWAFGPRGTVEIGILLLPEHRGHGHGTIAQRMLVDHLFATTTVHRIQATTEVDNVAEQRALERAGFVREGVLRGGSFVRGAWRDYVLFAQLRGDPRPVL